MKKQIRSNVFETNSSSTHSIAIPREAKQARSITFSVGEFGWDYESVDPADYFYTAIYETSDSAAEVAEKIAKLKDILGKRGIEYTFYEPSTHVWHDSYDGKDYLSLDDGYIDHGGELRGFVNDLLDNEDKLTRFLSCGLVFTGNDNDSDNGFVNRESEYVRNYDWVMREENVEENPYYMENHMDYDWVYKGN